MRKLDVCIRLVGALVPVEGLSETKRETAGHELSASNGIKVREFANQNRDYVTITTGRCWADQLCTTFVFKLLTCPLL
jgi:hypothetical protein